MFDIHTHMQAENLIAPDVAPDCQYICIGLTQADNLTVSGLCFLACRLRTRSLPGVVEAVSLRQVTRRKEMRGHWSRYATMWASSVRNRSRDSAAR